MTNASVDTVFFDVDTQLDFLSPSGALYVPGAEALISKFAVLNRWAEERGIPVVSTVDAHTEDDPEFASWPPHCVAGTLGQRKPAELLLDKRVVVRNEAGDPATLADAAQYLVEKQTFDCFFNPNLSPLLARWNAKRYVVYGVVTEICVAFEARGLLKTGARVEIVTDAVKELSVENRDRFYSEFQAAGGMLTTIAALVG